jgi:hypothetical protein
MKVGNAQRKHFTDNAPVMGNIRYATLSAGEFGINTFGGSLGIIKLESSVNRAGDIKLSSKIEIINMGRIELNKITKLFELEKYYRYNNIQNVNYWFFPEDHEPGKYYNSNSFVNGLLKAADIESKKPTNKVPGWESWLPSNMFGVY